MREKKKSNGEGSICLETATGRFRAAITDTQGKRIVKRFATRQEALEWLTITKAEIYQNTYIPKSDITLGEWLLEYLRIYCKPNVRAKTFADYSRSAGFLTPLFNLKLQAVNAAMVQKFYNDSLNTSQRTKQQVHRLLKAAITKAVNLDMLNKNFMNAVVAPKYETPELNVFTKEEVIKILNAIKTSRYYAKYYPFFLTAFTTGARLGELLALRCSSIGNGYIQISSSFVTVRGKMVEEPPKTKAGNRKITIDAETEKALRSLLVSDSKVIPFTDLVFHTETGKPIEQTNIGRVWRAIQKLAGVERRKFHAIRHTHASQLITIGVPIPEVSKRLGHKNITHTLKFYTQAIPQADSSIPEKIAGLFL